MPISNTRIPGRSRYFVNGLGLGFNGTVTRESRRIRHLQGLALYGLAVLRTFAPICVLEILVTLARFATQREPGRAVAVETSSERTSSNVATL